MDYLPITVQMKSRRCLIVGGGEVAARKLKHLLTAQSEVTLVSPEISAEIRSLASEGQVELRLQTFHPELLTELTDLYLVVAATDDRMANRAVSVAARQQNIWVNVVDDLALSTFIMPAIIDRSPLLIAISSSGVSPVLARKIREKIEWLLPRNLGKLLKRLVALRPQVKKKYHRLKDKRQFSEWFIETAINDSGTIDGATLIEENDEEVFSNYEQLNQQDGRVYLVGAGPGDPELLTVKALKVLQKADVVLYDALVSQPILDCIRKDATQIHVGKRASHHFVSQEQTNELLVKYAKQGLSVVRLKGGDPFIFGRGGEELQVLASQQISYQVVPGITAAAGCAAYAGIPLTHRDYSQSVRFVTGHEKQNSSNIDWAGLAGPDQTLVFYMGLMKSESIAANLVKHGKLASTPIAVIEKGTTKEQRVITGNLVDLAALVSDFSVESPALIVVGEVAALANELGWFNLQAQHLYQANEIADCLAKVANQ